MVHVIATLHVRPGGMARMREIYRDFAPRVRDESGCIEYRPTVDTDADLPNQRLDEDRVTVVEKWESMDAFRAHLVAPHVVDYRESVRGLVESVTVRVLTDI